MPERASFLAIDFETATGSPDSACSVGVAHVEGGSIIETSHVLINPGIPGPAWNPYNSRIHGISPDDVEDAADFADVWDDLTTRFAGLPLVAHNAVFDMGVIRASAESRGLQVDPIPYLCSVKLSRAAWPDMKSVRLNLVAERLGIELDHHNAESDAQACGEVTLHALDRLGADSLEVLVAERGWTWGKLA